MQPILVESSNRFMNGYRDTLIIAALVFVPLYLNAKITTIPEFLGQRFDRRSQVFFSVVTILTSILVETAGGLYAGAIVLKTFSLTLSFGKPHLRWLLREFTRLLGVKGCRVYGYATSLGFDFRKYCLDLHAF